MFGDGSRPAVLEAAGVENPRAFLVSHRNKEQVCSRAEGQGEVLCAFLVGHQNQELHWGGAGGVVRLPGQPSEQGAGARSRGDGGWFVWQWEPLQAPHVVHMLLVSQWESPPSLPLPPLLQALHVVQMLHVSHPSVPIYACGTDLRHAAQLEQAGAYATVVTTAQVGRGGRCS